MHSSNKGRGHRQLVVQKVTNWSDSSFFDHVDWKSMHVTLNMCKIAIYATHWLHSVYANLSIDSILMLPGKFVFMCRHQLQM